METKLASLSEKKDKYGDNLGWKVRLFDGNEVGGLFIDQEGAIKLEEKINKAADAWAASLVAGAVKKEKEARRTDLKTELEAFRKDLLFLVRAPVPVEVIKKEICSIDIDAFLDREEPRGTNA